MQQQYDDIVSVREAILRGGSEDTYENIGGQSTSPHPPADGGSGFSSRRHSSNSSKSSTSELSSQKVWNNSGLLLASFACSCNVFTQGFNYEHTPHSLQSLRGGEGGKEGGGRE